MATSKSLQPESTPIRIGRKLGKSFHRLEERIRERAYQLFLAREADEGDSMTDWLEAQLQLMTPLELALKDQKKNIVVEGYLKGFSPKEIEVEVGAAEVRVFGSHAESTTGKKSGISQSSSSTMHFFQALPLPCEVDPDTAAATVLKNGKLKITLPKKAGPS